MKNVRSIFYQKILSGLTISLTLLLASTALAQSGYVSVIKDGVNIRFTPSTQGEVSSEVFTGFPLQIIKSKGEWTEVVDFEGDQGWIHNSLISPKKSVIVKAKKINLLETPDSDDDNQIIVIARYGVTLTPLESRGAWLKVRHEDGTEGWVKDDQIWPAKPFDTSIEKPATAKPAKPKKKSPMKTAAKKHPTKGKKKQGQRR